MSDDEPPTEIENFHCVDEHRAVERDGRMEHQVVFAEDLEFVYGRLLDVIRAHGYEVVAFGPNRPFSDPHESDDVEPTMQKSDGETDGRTWAVLVETDRAYDYSDIEIEDPPEWITDVPV